MKKILGAFCIVIAVIMVAGCGPSNTAIKQSYVTYAKQLTGYSNDFIAEQSKLENASNPSLLKGEYQKLLSGAHQFITEQYEKKIAKLKPSDTNLIRAKQHLDVMTKNFQEYTSGVSKLKDAKLSNNVLAAYGSEVVIKDALNSYGSEARALQNILGIKF